MPTRKKTLRDMRLNKRLTQAEVAKRMKVSQSYYSGIERGRRAGEIADAMKAINRMRTRTDRTEGGSKKAGRKKR